MDILIGLFDLQLGNKENIYSEVYLIRLRGGGFIVLFANISGHVKKIELPDSSWMGSHVSPVHFSRDVLIDRAVSDGSFQTSKSYRGTIGKG